MSKPDLASLESVIENAFEGRDAISTATRGEVRDAVGTALDLLDKGQARVAERLDDGSWKVNQWLKKAVLLSFRLNPMEVIEGGPGGSVWWDKVPSKFEGWGAAEFEKAGMRAVPSAIVRRSAYVAPGVVLMPSFVNLGAYVDSGTMVDTWASVGSCAQIGKNVHLSGGVGIGGASFQDRPEQAPLEGRRRGGGCAGGGGERRRGGGRQRGGGKGGRRRRRRG